MVGQDIGDLLGGKVGKTRANVLDGGVVWSEDGDVGGSVDSVDEVGCVEGTTQRGEVGSSKRVGSSLGQGQETVDNVNHTASEVHVLYVC